MPCQLLRLLSVVLTLCAHSLEGGVMASTSMERKDNWKKQWLGNSRRGLWQRFLDKMDPLWMKISMQHPNRTAQKPKHAKISTGFTRQAHEHGCKIRAVEQCWKVRAVRLIWHNISGTVGRTWAKTLMQHGTRTTQDGRHAKTSTDSS